MAGEKLDKLKSGFNKGITTLNLKTTSALEKSKIKTHISTLTAEIEQSKSNLGAKVYNAWLTDSFAIEDCFDDFYEIKDKFAEIDELYKAYQQVDKNERSVLGNTKLETDESEEKETLFTCAGCGTVYNKQVKFCPKCGFKMI